MHTLTQRLSFPRQAFLVLAGSILLAVSAQLTIPLLPVPVTFQTMAVLILAILLGPQLAFFATMTYLIEGLIGLPVFAEFSAGLPVFLGVTGGYLLAMPFAAFIAGVIARKHTFVNICLAGFASTILTLGIGTLYLSHLIGQNQAFAYGFKPFVLIEVIKVIAVALGVSLSARCRKQK